MLGTLRRASSAQHFQFGSPVSDSSSLRSTPLPLLRGVRSSVASHSCRSSESFSPSLIDFHLNIASRETRLSVMEPAPQGTGQQQGRQQQQQPVYDIRNGGHYGKLQPFVPTPMMKSSSRGSQIKAPMLSGACRMTDFVVAFSF